MKTMILLAAVGLFCGSIANASPIKTPLLNCSAQERMGPVYILSELSSGRPTQATYILERSVNGGPADAIRLTAEAGDKVSVNGNSKISVDIKRGRSGSGTIRFDKAKKVNKFVLNNLQVQSDTGTTGWTTQGLSYRCFQSGL